MGEQQAKTKIKKSHLGIYAIIENDQSILLVKKTRGPYMRMWDLSGGSPLHGETFLQMLQREVFEETGIHLIEAVPHNNHSLTLEYKDGDQIISFHHTCLIYRAVQFDLSQFMEISMKKM
jgi:8-oxo-dGTP diphosphatase